MGRPSSMMSRMPRYEHLRWSDQHPVRLPWRAWQGLNRPMMCLLAVIGIILIISIYSTHQPHREKDFFTEFSYPLDIDVWPQINHFKEGRQPSVAPINQFNYNYLREADKTCLGVEPYLLFIVKSALPHLDRRRVIRQAWGSQTRFSNVTIRTVFLIGIQTPSNDTVDNLINAEDNIYNDLVQADFIDSYYNNTLKTMMGFKWAVQHCPRAQFAVFSDDDMYLSALNILRFVHNPDSYPDIQSPSTGELNSNQKDLNLYAGYVFTNMNPIRDTTSKWYISTDEYAYNTWPPYVTAGAYIISRQTLSDLYFASFYTQFFRFDDIFLGLVALKANIHLHHSPEVYFWKKTYSLEGYKNIIASHGYDDPNELFQVWYEQNKIGHA